MLLAQSTSFHVFCGCVLAGLIIGLCYDLFSLLRFPFRSVWADAFFDVLFYICALAVSALALLFFNDGRIRIYALFAILLGAYIYLRFPSLFFRMILRRLFKICSK